MGEKLFPINIYHLSGGDVTVAFRNEGPGAPELEYKDKTHEQTFSGREIQLEKTGLGSTASVVLEFVADAYTLTFTLALPAGNRPENIKSINITSFGVLTMSRTTIAGPGTIEGQIDTYEVVTLKGNAW